MEQMKELYLKVAADSTLQARFAEIMKNAEASGKEATEAKLITFAKDAGYDVSIDEAKAFFDKQAKSGGELDDAELEMVAGGKGPVGQWIDGAFKGVVDFFNDFTYQFTNTFINN